MVCYEQKALDNLSRSEFDALVAESLAYGTARVYRNPSDPGARNAPLPTQTRRPVHRTRENGDRIMTTSAIAYPRIVSREEWLCARKDLHTMEKGLTRRRDAVSAKHHRLPMVKVNKGYVFDGPRGKVRLLFLGELLGNQAAADFDGERI